MSTESGLAEDAPLDSRALEWKALSERVDRSVRELRTLKLFLAALLLLGFTAIFTMHQMGLVRFQLGKPLPAATVESHEFGFYNQFDTRVVLVDKDKFGYPNLIFMDLKKQYRMAVKVWPEGDGTPGLVFYDGSGIRGHLRMSEDQSSVLKLNGPGGKGSISLSVSSEGAPTFIMTDKAGKVLFAVPEGATEPKPPDQGRPGVMPGRSDPRSGPAS